MIEESAAYSMCVKMAMPTANDPLVPSTFLYSAGGSFGGLPPLYSPSGALQAKRKCKEGAGTYTRPFLHQSHSHALYVGWRRRGARPGGWAGASRDGTFGIGRVTGSSGVRVTGAPWCATSSGAP